MALEAFRGKVCQKRLFLSTTFFWLIVFVEFRSSVKYFFPNLGKTFERYQLVFMEIEVDILSKTGHKYQLLAEVLKMNFHIILTSNGTEICGTAVLKICFTKSGSVGDRCGVHTQKLTGKLTFLNP